MKGLPFVKGRYRCAFWSYFVEVRMSLFVTETYYKEVLGVGYEKFLSLKLGLNSNLRLYLTF